MLSHRPFVSQTRCYACILYVEDLCLGGASGLRCYHIMQMMVPLSGVTVLKDEASEGSTVGRRNPKYLTPHTKDDSLVVRSWMSCHFGEKQPSRLFSFRVHRWPFEFYTSCLWVSRQWWSLMSLPSDRAEGREAVRVPLKVWDKEADVTVPLWDDWFPSSLCGDCWSEIFCPCLLNCSRDSGDSGQSDKINSIWSGENSVVTINLNILGIHTNVLLFIKLIIINGDNVTFKYNTTLSVVLLSVQSRNILLFLKFYI